MLKTITTFIAGSLLPVFIFGIVNLTVNRDMKQARAPVVVSQSKTKTQKESKEQSKEVKEKDTSSDVDKSDTKTDESVDSTFGPSTNTEPESTTEQPPEPADPQEFPPAPFDAPVTVQPPEYVTDTLPMAGESGEQNLFMTLIGFLLIIVATFIMSSKKWFRNS